MSGRPTPRITVVFVALCLPILILGGGCGKSRAESYNRMGEAKLAQGDLEGAETAFDKALEIAPEFAIATRNLGRVHATKGEDDKAKELFDKAIKLDPREARAYAELGLLAMKHEDYDHALRFCDESVLLDDGESISQACACVARATKGQTGGAIRACKRAIELDPVGCPMVVYFSLGRLLEEVEDVDGSIEAYKGALARAPNYTDAHHRIAGMYAQKREDQQALWHLKKAIEIDPNYFNAYRSIIEYYIREKNLEEAKQWMIRANQITNIPFSIAKEYEELEKELAAGGQVDGDNKSETATVEDKAAEN